MIRFSLSSIRPLLVFEKSRMRLINCRGMSVCMFTISAEVNSHFVYIIMHSVCTLNVRCSKNCNSDVSTFYLEWFSPVSLNYIQLIVCFDQLTDFHVTWCECALSPLWCPTITRTVMLVLRMYEVAVLNMKLVVTPYLY